MVMERKTKYREGSKNLAIIVVMVVWISLSSLKATQKKIRCDFLLASAKLLSDLFERSLKTGGWQDVKTSVLYKKRNLKSGILKKYIYVR